MSLEQGNFQARGCDQWGKGGRGCGYGLRPSSRQPPKRGRTAPSRGYSQPTGPCHSARPSPGPATQTCPPDPGHSHESPVPRLFCKELQVSVMEKKKKITRSSLCLWKIRSSRERRNCSWLTPRQPEAVLPIVGSPLCAFLNPAEVMRHGSLVFCL